MSALKDSISYKCDTNVAYNITHKNLSKIILFDEGCDRLYGSWNLLHIDDDNMGISGLYRLTLN